MMDFVVDKKLFDSAARQILFGRKSTPAGVLDLTAEGSLLTVVAMGTSIEIPIVCETSGSVSVSVGDLEKLKKISATYKAGPIRIRIADGRIRFQTTAITACISEKSIVRRVIDIPNDANAMDLLSLQAIFSVDEIEDCGLHPKVLEARRAFADRIDSAASSLSNYGLSRNELSALAETKLSSHAKTMRRVLFPDDDQQVSSSSEQQQTGEIRMNESEMKAELERLRAENAQLKTKEKGGISLKVSEKGALSLYGMGRFPVTLYKEQWLRILASAGEIEAFIRENESKLKAKE